MLRYDATANELLFALVVFNLKIKSIGEVIFAVNVALETHQTTAGLEI